MRATEYPYFRAYIEARAAENDPAFICPFPAELYDTSMEALRNFWSGRSEYMLQYLDSYFPEG